jgi:hypothetical protein
MENLIVGIIVGLAAVWAGYRLFGRHKSAGCSAGCAGCTTTSKPQPLVQLRR